MMKFVYILIYTMLCQTTLCQTGFNRIYDFDINYASFINMALNNDTLEIVGVIPSSSMPTQQGIIFAKIDTSGEVFSFSEYFDEQGDDYTGVLSSSIVRLKDGSGYAITGNLLSRKNGILILIDNQGKLIKASEYEDITSRVDFFSKIIETDYGFLILGAKQRQDYSVDAFALAVNKEGNKIWEKYYGGSINLDWFLSGVYMENENSFILGIESNNIQYAPKLQQKIQTVILAIDSLGKENWRWQSPLALAEGAAGDIQKTSNGNWIYVTIGREFKMDLNYWASQGKVIERDKDFNLVWETSVGLPNSPSNYLLRIMPSSDDTWVVAGACASPDFGTPSGCVVKLSEFGDSIWSRFDNAFNSPTPPIEHNLGGLIVLPSGNILACGYINDYVTTKKTWAWLLKITKDGCLDSCATLGTNGTPIEGALNIYPNPTKSYITYFSSQKIEWEKIEIFDNLGNLVGMVLPNDDEVVDLAHYSPGIYFLRFNKSSEYFIKRIIKVN